MQFKWVRNFSVGLSVLCFSGVANAIGGLVVSDARFRETISVGGTVVTKFRDEMVEKDFKQSKEAFLKEYNEFRPRMVTNVDLGSKVAEKYHESLVRDYKSYVIDYANLDGQKFQGNCNMFSVVVESMLSKCGIENYRIVIGAADDSDGHVANMYRLGGCNWFVADPMADIQTNSDGNHYLQIPLAEYSDTLKRLYGFDYNVPISVEVYSDSMRMDKMMVLNLDAFMTLDALGSDPGVFGYRVLSTLFGSEN